MGCMVVPQQKQFFRVAHMVNFFPKEEQSSRVVKICYFANKTKFTQCHVHPLLHLDPPLVIGVQERLTPGASCRGLAKHKVLMSEIDPLGLLTT
jgi:hypothetical protein